MQIEIDPLSNIALYQQLRDRVVEGIAAGRLRTGDQLVPVRTLAAQFGINIATVGKGYELLRNEGLVRTNRTAGTVVARAPGATDASAWADTFRTDWERRLETMLAEGIAQGEPDEAITAAVTRILTSYAASRAGAAKHEGAEGAGDAD